MSTINIVDTNAIGLNIQMREDSPLNNGDFDVTGSYGLFNHLRTIKETFGGKIICLWDGKSQYRKNIYPEYKANRAKVNEQQKAKKDAWQTQVPHIKMMLNYLGIDQMIDYNAEADDIAAKISQEFAENGDQVNLFTSDSDWIQLVRNGVTFHDTKKALIIDLYDFEEMTGFKSPSQFVQCKALTGDTADNISGVGGIGDKGAKQLLKDFYSVEQFISKYNKETHGKVPAAWLRLIENEPFEYRNKQYDGAYNNFIRNLSLVDLRLDFAQVDFITTEGYFSPNVARQYMERVFKFPSVVNKFDQWVEPFV